LSQKDGNNYKTKKGDEECWSSSYPQKIDLTWHSTCILTLMYITKPKLGKPKENINRIPLPLIFARLFNVDIPTPHITKIKDKNTPSIPPLLLNSILFKLYQRRLLPKFFK